jgi:exosortase
LRAIKKEIVWIGLITLTAAVVYNSIILDLVRDWIHDSNYSHGFLIPVVSGFLIWQRRKELAATPLTPSTAGLIGVVASASLLILGAAGAEVFTQRVSLLLFMASTVVFLTGWRWFKGMAFPIGFLLLAIPMPYVLYYSLTGPMQAFAAKCAITGLQVVGVPAIGQGNIIHLPQTSLEVAEACSGIRSLYSFLALGALLAHSMPIPVWGRFLVFFLTIPLSVAGNAIRVWASGVGAYTIGPEATEGTIHELFGLIIFASALGLYILVRKGVRNLWQSAH